MNDRVYRILAGFTAFGIWFISFRFSVDGFGMLSPNPDYMWIGNILALSITAYELIWNGMKTRDNETMYWVGLGCYVYGIFTNILGCAKWLGFTKETIMSVGNSASKGDWWNIAVVIIYAVFIIALSIMFEAAPEPTMVYSITGKFNGGDFIGNLIGKQFHATNNSISNSLPPRQNFNRPITRPQQFNKPKNNKPQMSFKPTGVPGEYVRNDIPSWEDSEEEFRNIMRDNR